MLSQTSSLSYESIQTQIGDLLLVGDGVSLYGLYMQSGPNPMAIRAGWNHEPAALAEPRSQILEYFARERTTFELRLALVGTPFQKRVWEALRSIPYGTTTSYREIAFRIGAPSAPRAVGLANGRNPISVIVPCHRVVGSNGSLTGYGGGLERKRALLDLEAGVKAG